VINLYEYNICTNADKVVFLRQCAVLEKHIPNLRKRQRLIDVDESETQIYTLEDKTIIVHNSYYIGAVYVQSDVDLLPYFNSKVQ